MTTFLGGGWWLLAPGERIPGPPTGTPYRYDGHRLTAAEIAERVAARAEEDAHNLRVAAYRADLHAGRPISLRLPLD